MSYKCVSFDICARKHPENNLKWNVCLAFKFMEKITWAIELGWNKIEKKKKNLKVTSF